MCEMVLVTKVIFCGFPGGVIVPDVAMCQHRQPGARVLLWMVHSSRDRVGTGVGVHGAVNKQRVSHTLH